MQIREFYSSRQPVPGAAKIRNLVSKGEPALVSKGEPDLPNLVSKGEPEPPIPWCPKGNSF